ncbi:MAG: hypothetical protein KJZ93_06645 [Caldilineaceae bacterium]|nr:hypothetical protein [Caldilineaceae bacterium]
MRRLGVLFPTCLLLAASLAACGMLAADGKLAVVAVARDDDRITWAVSEDRVRFDIYSTSGIGRATVHMVADPYPAQIVLRFHLRGLEELRFVYQTTVISVAVASIGERAVHQQVALGEGEAQTIAPDSPYWMKTTLGMDQPPSSNPGSSIDGYVDVELPSNFLQGEETTFSIAWIDFFR